MVHIFDDCLYRFGLHDCVVNNVTSNNGIISLIFESGIYYLDDSGKEVKLTGTCKMLLTLDTQYSQNIESHITITRKRRRKILDIPLKSFEDNVNRSNYEILAYYCSSFNNAMLFRGYVGKWQYDLEISEISKIQFAI